MRRLMYAAPLLFVASVGSAQAKPETVYSNTFELYNGKLYLKVVRMYPLQTDLHVSAQFVPNEFFRQDLRKFYDLYRKHGVEFVRRKSILQYSLFASMLLGETGAICYLKPSYFRFKNGSRVYVIFDEIPKLPNEAPVSVGLYGGIEESDVALLGNLRSFHLGSGEPLPLFEDRKPDFHSTWRDLSVYVLFNTDMNRARVMVVPINIYEWLRMKELQSGTTLIVKFEDEDGFEISSIIVRPEDWVSLVDEIGNPAFALKHETSIYLSREPSRISVLSGKKR